MESTFSKLLAVLMAVGLGYMIYQKTSARPPPVQLDSAKSPQGSLMTESAPMASIVVPSSETTSQQSGSQPEEQPPAAASSPRQPELQTNTADVNNINAVPLPNLTTQRRAYYDFLSKRNPRAFLICNDNSVKVVAGGLTYVNNQIAEVTGRCAPYAIDDAVVWTGK